MTRAKLPRIPHYIRLTKLKTISASDSGNLDISLCAWEVAFVIRHMRNTREVMGKDGEDALRETKSAINPPHLILETRLLE